MNAEVTDPELLAQLNAPDPSPSGKEVTDPKILAQLNATPNPHPDQPSTGINSMDSLPFTDKVHLGMADNFEEKELYFQNKYGKGNVKREWGGNGEPTLLIKTPGGATYRVGGETNFIAQLTADLPELGGMAAGAVYGAEAGVAGGPPGILLGGLVGAGVGAAVGHGAKETLKAAGGDRITPSVGDEVKGDVQAFNRGVISQGIGGVVGKGVGKLLTARVPKFFTGATDQSISQTKRAWNAGAVPPYVSMAPDARKLARIETDAEKVVGVYKAQDDRNMAYVLSEMKNTLKGQGVPDAHANQLIEEIKNPQSAFSHEEVGQELKDGVQAHVTAMTDSIAISRDTATKLVDTQMSTINSAIDRESGGPLSERVQASISGAREQFNEAARSAYDRIDRMTGGAKVVPVDIITDAAKAIKAQLPKSKMSAMVAEASKLAKKPLSDEDAILLQEFNIELPPGDKISLSDAQRFRTILRQEGKAIKSGESTKSRTVQQGDFLELATAFDRAITAAGEDSAVAPAIKALRETDTWYKANVAKFYDPVLNKLVSATRSGLPPEPGKIVDIITRAGNSSRIGQLRKLVGEDTWRQVQAVHMRKFMQSFTSTNEQGKPVIDGMKMLDRLSDKDAEPGLRAVYGDNVASLKEIARMAAAQQGKLAPETLANGDVKTALRTMQGHQKRLDEFMNKNGISMMADPKTSGVEAYNWAVQPGEKGEARTLKVAKIFGSNSAQMSNLRQAALEDLSRSVQINTLTEQGNNAIDKALNAFTKKQQDILFPGTMVKDMRSLSDVVKFMFPFKADPGMAGMHAGAVLEKPLKQRLYKQATAAVMRFVALHPSFARWIVTGREEGEFPWMVRTASLFEKMAKATAVEASQPDRNQTSQQPPHPGQQLAANQ